MLSLLAQELVKIMNVVSDLKPTTTEMLTVGQPRLLLTFAVSVILMLFFFCGLELFLMPGR